MLRGCLTPGQALEDVCKSLGLDPSYADAFIQKIKEL